MLSFERKECSWPHYEWNTHLIIRFLTTTISRVYRKYTADPTGLCIRTVRTACGQHAWTNFNPVTDNGAKFTSSCIHYEWKLLHEEIWKEIGYSFQNFELNKIHTICENMKGTSFLLIKCVSRI